MKEVLPCLHRENRGRHYLINEEGRRRQGLTAIQLKMCKDVLYVQQHAIHQSYIHNVRGQNCEGSSLAGLVEGSRASGINGN